ncbi:MAG TPA: FHA domain-containing protein [Acidimicrobiales bacterium]|nr:FHA domain-containing protein [Acidimicrobiales bacterium]
MSDQLLTILKFFLIALVWLFFLRVLRAVWVDLRASDAEAAPGPPLRAATPAPAPAPPPRRAGPLGRKPPSRVRVVEPDEMAGRSFEVSDGMTVGRSSRCDITLDGDSYASSSHARFLFNDGKLWVEDLKSTNGTFVNSSRVDGRAALKRGDRVQIGRTVFEVSA